MRIVMSLFSYDGKVIYKNTGKYYHHAYHEINKLKIQHE